MVANVAADLTQAGSLVTVAGGAFLEWLEGKTLPGVASLEGCARRAATWRRPGDHAMKTPPPAAFHDELQRDIAR